MTRHRVINIAVATLVATAIPSPAVPAAASRDHFNPTVTLDLTEVEEGNDHVPSL